MQILINILIGIAQKPYISNSKNLDGAILTFEAIHPKWSYAKCDEEGYVTEVAEKVISKNATVGVYYWKHGSD